MEKNKNKSDFMDGVAGSFKPLLILVVGLFFFGKTVKDDYDKYRKTYKQVAITAIDGIDLDEFELTGFMINKIQINGKDKGGIDLYVNENDTQSKVTLIVDDFDHFLEDHQSKNKVIVKNFEGVHQGSPRVVKDYIATYGVKNTNSQPTKIFIYEEYFRWQSVLWIYSLFTIGILFLLVLILGRIRVY